MYYVRCTRTNYVYYVRTPSGYLPDHIPSKVLARIRNDKRTGLVMSGKWFVDFLADLSPQVGVGK